MGGAALGADMTDGPPAVVPGSLGVFGGTFDPIHLAHLAVAQEAAEALGLERIVFVPAGEPPHKPGRAITPGAQRLAMLELAIAGNDRFAIDRRELDRGGPSYTVDTLEDMARGSAGRLAGPRADPVRGGVPRAHDLAPAGPDPRARPRGGRAAGRLSGRRPATSSRPTCPISRIARPSSIRPGCGCRRASCVRAQRPADPCAISCRMRSRPTSATMGCTEIT